MKPTCSRRRLALLRMVGATGPLLGMLLGASACIRDEREGTAEQVGEKVDEAIEELRDEAMDVKDEIDDEIDDHT